MNPIFDAHTPNGASQGVEANPSGTVPVTTVTAQPLTSTGGVWTSANPIFLPGPACPTEIGCGAVTYNIFTVTQQFHTPYVHNFNLNIEEGLGKSLLWQAGYVSSAAHHLLTVADLNQPALGIGALPFGTRFPTLA